MRQRKGSGLQHNASARVTGKFFGRRRMQALANILGMSTVSLETTMKA